MKKHLKHLHTKITEDGEMFETVKHFSIKVDTPEAFYMTYIQAMSSYFKIKSALDYKVLAKLCCNSRFNTGTVDVSMAMRKHWCEEFEVSTQNISNSLKRLIDLKLISGGKGSYVINPSVYWKGDSDTRKLMLKSHTMKITFELESEL
jgi:hypothetical protein